MWSLVIGHWSLTRVLGDGPFGGMGSKCKAMTRVELFQPQWRRRPKGDWPSICASEAKTKIQAGIEVSARRPRMFAITVTLVLKKEFFRRLYWSIPRKLRGLVPGS